MKKKQYQVPRLIVHGTVAHLTQMNVMGTKLDRMLNAGDPTPPSPNLPSVS